MSAAGEFSSPNVEAKDYYERLGVPEDASAEEIANHTKKYVAKLKPELSDHDNADERWDRFNNARQTLNEAEIKAEYDTFRERFGPQDGAEAYEAWEARDRPGDPATLDPARQLDRPSIGKEDSTASDEQTAERQTANRQTDGRQQRRSREHTQRTSDAERQRRRRERQRRRREADIDLDSSKAYSTRNVDRDDEDDEEVTEETAGQSTARQVLSHLRESGRVATREVATALGMLELVVVGYAIYALVVQFGAARVADAAGTVIAQNIATVGVVLGVGFVIVSRYLQRFGADPANPDGRPSPGRQLIRDSDTPRWFVYGPAVAGVLFAGLLPLGGGGTTLLFVGLAMLFTYGRYRVVAELVPTPDWSDSVDVAGGVGAAVLFIVIFVLSTPDAGIVASVATAGPAVALAVVALTTAVVVIPSVALWLGDREEANAA
ncbi:DnaJ domain-containing protein [Halorientalis sp.]|uniref:DnaJ domain-containing protein n=1 Tax=Halorientalis sp. TaxID=1931229 RepID=UPI002607ABAC|nr:DnaJ domain-containing protein [Halorientalis sp.]